MRVCARAHLSRHSFHFCLEQGKPVVVILQPSTKLQLQLGCEGRWAFPLCVRVRVFRGKSSLSPVCRRLWGYLSRISYRILGSSSRILHSLFTFAFGATNRKSIIEVDRIIDLPASLPLRTCVLGSNPTSSSRGPGLCGSMKRPWEDSSSAEEDVDVDVGRGCVYPGSVREKHDRM